MKFSLGLLSVLTCLFGSTLNASDPLPAYAARLTGGGTVRIAVMPPEGSRFAHLSWTKAVRTAKGTIVLFYVAGTFHGNGGGGSPAVSLSHDGGRTFTAPKVLREFGPGMDYTQSGNVALGIAGDGALVGLAMAYTDDAGHHIFGWRSTDDGETWKPVDTSALGPNKTGSVFGNILPVAGQGLVVLGHYRKSAQSDLSGIWLSASKDEGLTWGEPRRISEAASVEPVLVQTAGGRLLAFLRGSSTALGGREFVAVSDDHGASWQTALSVLDAENPASARLAAPCAVENPNQPGEMLVLTTERHAPGNTPGRIWLWRGDARKLDWKRDRVLLEFPHLEGDAHTDFGYPWLLHVEGHRWLMFYYHGAPRAVCPLWVAEVEL